MIRAEAHKQSEEEQHRGDTPRLRLVVRMRRVRLLAPLLRHATRSEAHNLFEEEQHRGGTPRLRLVVRMRRVRFHAPLLRHATQSHTTLIVLAHQGRAAACRRGAVESLCRRGAVDFGVYLSPGRGSFTGFRRLIRGAVRVLGATGNRAATLGVASGISRTSSSPR